MNLTLKQHTVTRMTKQKSTAVYPYYVYVHNIDIIIMPYELCRDRLTNNIYSDTDSLVIFLLNLFSSLNGIVLNENP